MIIKPISDKNEYMDYYLNNGIEVVNVNDHQSSNSTVVVSVGVGQLQDPEDVQGLAHFLEHMLFMGSDKFQGENEFSNFIQKNNGYSNAYTSNENTTYYFTIDSTVLDKAINMLAQFFISPLISQESLEKEINAVNSEHIKNIPNESRRFYQVLKTIANEGSEMRKYGCGTKETISKKFKKENDEIDYTNMKNALKDFYEKYYKSSNIKIVIVSNLSLDEQKNIVEKYFSKVKKQEKNVIATYKTPYNLAKNGNYKLTFIKTKKDIEQLYFFWFFPKETVKNITHKHFLCEILGDETENSLALQLYKKGLTISLQSGSLYDDRLIDSICIMVTLTKQGVDQVGDIVKTVFDYVETVKQLSNDRTKFDDLFNEFIKIDNAEFDYRDKKKDTEIALMISDNLFNFDTKYCIGGHIKDTKLGEQNFIDFKGILDELGTSNCLVFLSHKNVDTDTVDEFMEVEYKTMETAISSLPETGLKLHFELPNVNKYVPKNLAIIEKKSELEKIDNNLYLRKTYFDAPKGLITTVVFTDAETEEQITLLNMYIGIKNKYIQEKFYDAIKAGYNIYITNYATGSPIEPYFSIVTEGYSDKAPTLHDDIVTCFFDTVNEESFQQYIFDSIRYACLKSIENAKMYQPTTVIMEKLNNLSSDLHYLPEEQKKTVEDSSIKKIIDSFNKLKFKQHLFYVGNFKKEDAKKTTTFHQDKVTNIDANKKDIFNNEYTEYLKSPSIKEDGLIYYYDIGPIDNNNILELYSFSELLDVMISDSFFEDIRTKHQVGYTVFNNSFVLGSCYNARLIISFIAQSGVKNVDEICVLFDNYFKNLGEVLSSSKDSFETSKQNIINTLKQPKTSNSEYISIDISEILGIKPHDFTEKLINELSKTTFETIINRYNDLKPNDLKKIKIKKIDDTVSYDIHNKCIIKDVK